MAVLPQITSKIFLYLLLCSAILATTFQGALCDTDVEGPSESECRPYIEKALKKLETGDTPEVAQEDVNLVVTENEDDSNSPPIGDVIETDDNEAALNLDEEQADQPESTQEDTESLETEGEPTENVAEETVDEQTETEKSEEQPISKECDSETGCATETASEENKEEDQTIETLSDENETAEDDQASTEAVQEAEASVEQSASEEEVVEQAGSTEAQADASEALASLEQEASSTEAVNASQEDASEQEQSDSDKQVSAENVSAKDENSAEDSLASEQDNASVEGAVTGEASQEETQENASIQESGENTAEQTDDSAQSVEQTEDAAQSVEQIDEAAQSVEQTEETAEAQSEEQTEETVEAQSAEQTEETVEAQSLEQTEESAQLVEQVEEPASSVEQTEDSTQSVEQTEEATQSSEQTEEVAQSAEQADESTQSIEQTEETTQSIEDATASVEQSEEATQSAERTEEAASSVEQTEAGSSVEQTETAEVQSAEQTEAAQSVEQTEEVVQSVEETEGEAQSESTEVQEEVQSEEKPVIVIEDLTFEFDIPTNLRPRDHVTEILQIDEGSNESELINIKAEESTLKELKRLYENAIKPLEVLYKYRDLSNRHFGDPEIYSKPLVLFMGPWSGGKSSIINYLLDNEYTDTSLRTGAEPSPAYFNIITHGEKTEVLDGTQLAADWTFSGLQKFGQGLEERLRGLKMPKKLLEKINIVEIPGILEVRKQVSRIFPFNDVCQWFIDRADIIFLVYDPSKLDVGPETEAILDQLKGREYQTRIILNKADQVKPEELMRVQGALIWNISPLMSSAQPPVMYSTSLWSRPYEIGAPIRLLEAQERAFLKDLKNAMDRRVENKIASARRFAVRVRNHAKMVDCYLTTYYNHKSVFGNRKLVSDQIIEHPQEYHIYEGLSTLTNISRYDLPDPDVYRDFFKLNPLYDFQQLSATCTYFRGCPINRLDISIAYDLPELVGKYKKMTENTLDSMKATLKS